MKSATKASGQRRGRAVLRAGLALLLAAAAGCMAPGGTTRFHYGDGPQCRVDTADVPHSLAASLDPLRAAFDECVDVPRVVALMPHMGCERGAEILRSEVLDAHPQADLRLFVIWQDVARTPDAAQAAARATRSLDDPRVVAFHDCAGLAGRAFARGNLPVAEAREVFLFYPAGASWPKAGAARRASALPERTPVTDQWVHQLGRVRPEKFCTPQELPREMRAAVGRLLEQARVRRSHLAGRAIADGAR